MTDTTIVEPIQELDLIVTKEPTNVWQLRHDIELDNLKLYEQWERGRPFKAKAIYHHPSGVDYYLRNEDDPFGVKVEDTIEPYEMDELRLAPERPGKRHQVADKEDIYSIAVYYKIPWEKILEFNELSTPSDIRTGQWLYIPPQVESKERKEIEYRLLDDPRPMHISLEGGTNKFTFGAVRKITDIKPELKHYDTGSNVTIHAIAKVPVEEDLHAYYMDRHDLGKYKETGRVAYTRGFNWKHLAEGHITVEKPVSKTEKIVADAMAEDDRPALPEKLEIAPESLPTPVENHIADTSKKVEELEVVEEPVVTPLEAELDEYKTSFHYLNVEESPERYTLLENVEIRELDGALPAKTMKAGQSVMVIGWFTYKGTPYYRVATRYWYAIPTQLAYSVENEPFNDFQVDLRDRITYGGALTSEERRIAQFAKVMAKYNRMKTLGGMLRRK